MEIILVFFPIPNFPAWSVAFPKVDKKFIREASSGVDSKTTIF